MSFRDAMLKAKEGRGSPIVLALDLPPDRPSKLMRKASRLLEALSPFICALKLNFHLILPLGLSGVKPLLDRAHEEELICIADPKLSDIGPTNELAARYY
ncbi:MAG TPA: orotidine 5'-phosphate decarboxylase, partial [Candidatus Bathyarchaeota archaeon]|nr:orotidine 5'-phosphate decarboxylase [Candidatus Bathyarchaeota archaeon]HEW89804.1 orotidine 5'-phosphate decarboxylase [Candidatus Bathyarchaeota archaeon]